MLLKKIKEILVIVVFGRLDEDALSVLNDYPIILYVLLSWFFLSLLLSLVMFLSA